MAVFLVWMRVKWQTQMSLKGWFTNRSWPLYWLCLYRLTAETGLRANELRSLKIASFDFDNLTVTVSAEFTKNGQEAVQSLRVDTATELKEFFKKKLPDTKAFGGTYKKLTPRTSMMLQADLADSGIPYVKDELYFDFHSLRHQTGTLLAASGVHPKVAQKIMRHSDINLTMSRYTHTLIGQEAKAVADLPDLTLPSNKSQTQKATGTDNQPVSAYKPAYKKLTKNAYSGFNQSSLVGIENKGENKISNCYKLSEPEALGSDKDSLSLNDTEWAGAELNRRHTDFQSVALPTELPARQASTTI